MEITINLGFLKIFTKTTKHQLIILILAIICSIQLWVIYRGTDERYFELFKAVIYAILGYAISNATTSTLSPMQPLVRQLMRLRRQKRKKNSAVGSRCRIQTSHPARLNSRLILISIQSWRPTTSVSLSRLRIERLDRSLKLSFNPFIKGITSIFFSFPTFNSSLNGAIITWFLLFSHFIHNLPFDIHSPIFSAYRKQ